MRARTAGESSSSIGARGLFFGGLALAIITIWIWLLHSDLLAARPLVAAWGATGDLLITIPLLYYLLLIRPGRASGATMIPVVAGALIAAEIIVPHDHRGLLMALGAGAELALVAWVILRARAAMRSARDADARPLEVVGAVLRGILPFRAAADAVLWEISIVYYALLSWRRERAEHERSFGWAGVQDWSSIVFGMGLVIVLESAAVHLWLMQRHPVAAWILTALDVYGILWLVADYRALCLSDTILGNRLDLRFGFRWKASLALDSIESIERITSDDEVWDLKMSLIERPDLLVTLHEPVSIEGPYGIRRRASRIGLRIADRSRFEAAARALNLWKDPAAELETAIEARPAPPPEEAARPRMAREHWLSTRPDYIPLEEWERHRPDWVDP